MPLPDRQAQADSMRRVLGHDGTVLVAGAARSSYWPTILREHPRITFWNDADAQSFDAHPPTVKTRVIICLRNISHSLFRKLQRFATKNHILMVPGFSHSGEIREVLARVFQLTIEASEEPAPDEPATPARARGAVKAFVLQHADLQTDNIAAEARRLLAMPDAKPLHTTLATVTQTIYMARLAAQEQPVKTPLPEPLPPPLPPPAPATRAPEALTQPQLPIDGHVGEALRLIDELAAGLGLVREAIVRVGQDDATTRNTLDRLRTFLEPLHLQ